MNAKSNVNSESDTPFQKIPGAEPSARIDPWWWLVLAVVVLIGLMVLVRPDPFQRIILFVSDGLWVSIYITLISFVLILVAGLFGGLGRLSKNRLIHGVSTLYVEIVRGIPLLVQLLFWYFAFPSIIQGVGETLNIEPLKNYLANAVGMAILGLTFCYAAYMSEIYRAGIQSIPKGQMEAARSLGMTYFQSMRYIIIPQAVRVILPPVGNEFISLLKDSSLVSVVAVADMTRRGREFMSANFIPVETWSMIALLYLVLTLFSARVVSWIEHKTRMEK
jgi:polar amino acid transport system permease protein